MAKIAKLVRVVLISRVIVEDTLPDEDVYHAAKQDLIEQTQAHYSESLDSIEEDTECPYEEDEEN